MGGFISRRGQQTVEKSDLHLAVEHDFPAWIKDLVQKGADVNELNSRGDTPLMVAIQHRKLKCAQELIICGADVNALSSIHYTALHYAAHQDSTECLEFLIQAGADVNFGDHVTPLLTAAWYGRDKNVLTLIKAGADVNIPRRVTCHTALSEAFREGNFECVKILIKAGADVNRTTDACATDLYSNISTEKYSYLCAAAWRDNIEIAKLLLKSGIKLDFPNKYTIGSYIRDNGHSQHANNFIMLLFAAGETVQENDTRLPGFLQELLKPDLNLMEICRVAIREHLMKLSDANLFVRIPQLELPVSVQSFLLYHVSLDNKK